jgi:hypothetical protein
MIHVHVAQERNINNVVANSDKIRVCGDFVHVKNTKK